MSVKLTDAQLVMMRTAAHAPAALPRRLHAGSAPSNRPLARRAAKPINVRSNISTSIISVFARLLERAVQILSGI
jgi:hypothetical protein